MSRLRLWWNLTSLSRWTRGDWFAEIALMSALAAVILTYPLPLVPMLALFLIGSIRGRIDAKREERIERDAASIGEQ